MDRRNFISAGIGLLGACVYRGFPLGILQEGKEPVDKLSVFRFSGGVLQQIDFERIRPGDKIVLVDYVGNKVEDKWYMRATTSPYPFFTTDSGIVTLGFESQELTEAEFWGTKTLDAF